MISVVTGATGFLGSNLVRHLLGRGDTVVALARRTSSLRRLEGIRDRIELRYAGLDDYPALLDAVAGADRVFHLAANVRLGSFGRRELFRDNVTGSENVLAAARERGVGQLIHVSSISIFGSAIAGVVTEDDVAKGRIMSTYGETKLAAYHGCRQAHGRGMDVRMAIPSNVFGPDDPNFGILFGSFVRGRLKVVAGNVNANLGLVFVDDVCDGLIRVAEHGRAGHAYVLNGANLSLGALLKLAGRITGISAPRHRVPAPVLKCAALLAELTGRAVGRYVVLNRQSANLLCTTHPTFDAGKARRELGWEPGPFEEAFAATLAWYQEHYAPLDRRQGAQRPGRYPAAVPAGAPGAPLRK